MHTKKILILTTGGTIAGSGDDPSQSAHYQAGTLKGSALLALLPSSQKNLEVQEIAQIDSIEINPCIWQNLLEYLEQDYEGFVITHGTDTLEESAFALHLLYRGKKPVVLVGAMRPSNAIGSDGIKNLYSAIALASDPKAEGVMVLMNDKIYHPQSIYKAHTYNLDAFKSRNGGEMGYVLDDKICLFSSSQKPNLPFKKEDLIQLPQVEIVYIYAGMQDLPLWNHQIKGLVIAGCGAGNIPKHIRQKLRLLQAQGLMIVAGSRGSEGFVWESEFIPAFGLNVAKCRILLSLCLQHSQSKKEIEKIFSLF